MTPPRQPSTLTVTQLAISQATGESDVERVRLIEEEMIRTVVSLSLSDLGYLGAAEFRIIARMAQELLRLRGALPMGKA